MQNLHRLCSFSCAIYRDKVEAIFQNNFFSNEMISRLNPDIVENIEDFSFGLGYVAYTYSLMLLRNES